MKKHISRRLLSLLLLLATVAVSVPFMGVTASAAAPASYTDIAVDEAKYVSVGSNGAKYFRFVPTRGGTYEIYSYSNSDDPYVELLNSSGSQLTYNDDGGDGYNFKLQYRFEVGVTYYIKARAWSSSSGSYTFKLRAISLDPVVEDEEEVLPPTGGAHSEYNSSTGDVFLGGNYLELGISRHGSFGTSTSPQTSGFHTTSNVGYRLGMMIDEDGWGTGNGPTTTDFFLPGDPEERYILSYSYGGTIYEYKVCDRNSVFTGTWSVAPTVRNASSGDMLRAVVTGKTTHGVEIEIIYSFGVNDKAFTTEFNITNTSSREITNLRFVRSFDPDQDSGFNGGGPNTYNKVISNPTSARPGGADNCAMVVARGHKSYEAFYFIAFDNRARVSRGVEFNLSSAYKTGLWSEAHSFPNAPTDAALAFSAANINGHTIEDSNIAVTFSLGTLATGASTSGMYYSSLTEDVSPVADDKILVIMDREPWSYGSIARMMNQLVTLGEIEGWDSVTTSEVTAEMLSSYAVVYVANDQPTAAQSRIRAMKTMLENYVRGGGVLIYGFLTMGTTTEYGSTLPGGVTAKYGSSSSNLIADATHPIITGVLSDRGALTAPDMIGSSASHDYIVASSLPAGNRVIVTDSSGRPTLVEYPLGEGTVIATGMTWEFYAYSGSGDGGFARKAYDDLFLYALSVSEGYTPPIHTHTESDWIVDSEPTCTSAGVRRKECTGCHVVLATEVIPATGHTPGEWVIDTEPTCEAAGERHADCTECGEAGRIFGYIPALRHRYTSTLTRAATCTTPGIMTYTCECGDSYDVYIYSEHHYEHTSRVDATCTEDGADIYTCDRCGDSYSIPIAGGHNYVAEIERLSTPTTPGLVRYTCSLCGDEYTEETPARPEANILLVQDRFPWSDNNNVALLDDMLADGYIDGWEMTTTARFAEVDLSQYNVILIANDQTTATYNQLRTLQDSLVAFANAGGVVIYGACDHGWAGGNISYTLPEGVSKTNYYSRHNYIVDATHPIVLGNMTDGKALTNDLLYGNYCSHTAFTMASLPVGANIILQDANGAPTLVEYAVGDGAVILSGLTWEFYYSRSAYDYRLNTTYTRNVYDDLIVYAASLANGCDHAWGEATVVDPTCTERGYTERICSLCGGSLKENYTEPLGHTLGDWETEIEPTPDTEGLKVKRCTVCGEIIIREPLPIPDVAIVYVTAPEDSVIIGETLTFTVVVEGADPIKSMALVPIFDNEYFELVDVAWSIDAFVNSIEEGTLRSVAAWATLTDVNTTVYTITLRAKRLTDATTVDFTAMLQDENGEIITATVVDKTVAIIECPHVEFVYSDMGDGYHVGTCALCGYVVMSAHEYDDACDATCDTCGYERVAPHAMGETWCTDEDGHWHECTLCGLHMMAGAHDFDDTADTSCETCGYERAMLGDLDDDGDRDSDDAVYLMYILHFGEEEYPKNQPIDFNGDGIENSDDAIYLLYNTFYGDELYFLNSTR